MGAQTISVQIGAEQYTSDLVAGAKVKLGFISQDAVVIARGANV